MLKTLCQALMILLLILPALEVDAQTETDKENQADKEKKKKPSEISTKVYNKVAPSVVKIECDGGNKFGTGTIVGLTANSRALILTACHVVAIEYDTTSEKPVQFHKDVFVRLATDTSTARVSVVLNLYHVKKDLALVVTREPVLEKNIVINYNRSKHAGPGTLVAAMGFPDSDKLSQTVGNIKRVEGGYLVFGEQIAEGSSGGPLIDKFGRMVGMSRLTFEDEGYAIPFDSLATIVDGWLQKIRLKSVWRRQKYGNFGQKMIYDWRFVSTELSIAGGIGYLLFRSIEPVLPEPPGPPSQ